MKRVVIYFNRDDEDPISVEHDKGIEVEVVNWQAIENNDCLQDGNWTPERVEEFAKWGKGLVADHVIEGLRELVAPSVERRDISNE